MKFLILMLAFTLGACATKPKLYEIEERWVSVDADKKTCVHAPIYNSSGEFVKYETHCY